MYGPPLRIINMQIKSPDKAIPVNVGKLLEVLTIVVRCKGMKINTVWALTLTWDCHLHRTKL